MKEYVPRPQDCQEEDQISYHLGYDAPTHGGPGTSPSIKQGRNAASKTYVYGKQVYE